ncbi:hypothetical protein [Roseivirga thermotolerans]|nr:hypothetical protein [Roseivirga thermotolerans]
MNLSKYYTTALATTRASLSRVLQINHVLRTAGAIVLLAKEDKIG